jgi:tetratricopeptide (TPR) repeat protein
MARFDLSRAGRGALIVGILVSAQAGTSGPARAEPAKSKAAQAADVEYQTAIREGDAAYLDKRFDGAESAYQKAVKRQPQKPEAYARLASAQRELGKFDEAIETLGRGLGSSSTVTERAKLIFIQADIQERKRALERATERWNAYLELSGGGGERTIDLDAPEQDAPVETVKGETVYPATALERLEQIAAAEKRYQEYGAVKERIRKREQEAETKARKR